MIKFANLTKFLNLGKINPETISVCIGYSVTASNDLSVIVIESQMIKSKTLPYHTNCIGYSDLGYSDKPGIMIGTHEA